MSRWYYDFHVHSCLSPCADNDNTPFNLAGMGKLAGLDMMALTDHNTCRNCPAFMHAAEQQGILPIPGMELTTAEDIHMVCLFATLENAMQFDRAVSARRIRIANRPDIFGEQILWGVSDEPVGEEPDLLSNATALSLEEAVALTVRCGGVIYPAHIDRQANGILAVLGALPPTPHFACVEFHDETQIAACQARFSLGERRVVVGSDAHYLWDIRDRAQSLSLEVASADGTAVRAAVLRYLGGDG